MKQVINVLFKIWISIVLIFIGALTFPILVLMPNHTNNNESDFEKEIVKDEI